MSFSTDRLFMPPEVEVDFFGFRAPAYLLQRSGWKFEQMQWAGPSATDPLGRDGCQVVMRHTTGLTLRADCDERILMNGVFDSMSSGRCKDPAVFFVRQAAAKPSEVIVHMPVQPQWVSRSMDMEPYPREMATVKRRRFTLADLYNQGPAEEIIVEPKTVAALLEEIKQLQAPELAAIRKKNHLRDQTRHLVDQPAPEWREEVSAQIITMRRAA